MAHAARAPQVSVLVLYLIAPSYLFKQYIYLAESPNDNREKYRFCTNSKKLAIA
ncbi:MAG: hypothetical protein WCP16_01530 [Pseudanabaena sp. ELA645]